MYTDYTTLPARMTSWQGLPYATELASIGTYRDVWNGDRITCHKCQLTFGLFDDIFMLMERANIHFEDAGLMAHTIQYPWCDFLKNISIESKNNILGIELTYFH